MGTTQQLCEPLLKRIMLRNLTEKLDANALKDVALQRAGGFGAELREFIARGSVVDLTVGVSIGTAFSNLINSFVNNILTPPLRSATNAAKNAISNAGQSVAGATGADLSLPPSPLGQFLGQLGSFALLVLATFLVVKAVNRFRRLLEFRAQQSAPKASAEPAVEDPIVRQIAQNERIIELLEKLNAKA